MLLWSPLCRPAAQRQAELVPQHFCTSETPLQHLQLFLCIALQAKRKRSAFPCFCHPVSLQFPDSCASPLPDLPTGRCFVVLLPGRSAPAASLLLLLSTQETREKGLMLTSAACTVSRCSSEGVNVLPLNVTEAICTP